MKRRQISLSYFQEQRPCVMIVSHERSGTHFLMNSLAACYGYLSMPWVDFDYQMFPINFFHPPAITNVLGELAKRGSLANVVKSHHQAGFFHGQLDALLEHFVIVYIYRHPVDVMISFWRYLHGRNWFEGPKVDSPTELAATEPCGQMMRLQQYQCPSILTRWETHVKGWLAANEKRDRMMALRFDDLDQRFEQTIASLSPLLGRNASQFTRPSKDENVVRGKPLALPENERERLHDFCQQQVGQTMRELGFE